ncbi:MAG: SWIM zinc finger domain-containing protein [Actinomycetota bacterium]|nr:SWIM zinc finger domain-containing protein [Actinomycetota bacterium]
MATTESSAPAHPSTREQRGLEVYRRGGIDRISRDTFLVPSCTRWRVDYLVDLERQSCECRDYRRTGGLPCKHIYGAMLFQAWLRRTARALSFALASPDEE